MFLILVRTVPIKKCSSSRTVQSESWEPRHEQWQMVGNQCVNFIRIPVHFRVISCEQFMRTACSVSYDYWKVAFTRTTADLRIQLKQMTRFYTSSLSDFCYLHILRSCLQTDPISGVTHHFQKHVSGISNENTEM